MVKDKVIKSSKSPWAFPIALVRESDAFSPPNIKDSLESLHGSRWFSTLDLNPGAGEKG